METTEGLAAKPFLAGASLSIERAQLEIAVFGAMVGSLPVGPGALVLDLGSGPCWISDWLRRLRYRTLSVDLCLDMLRIGRRRMGPDAWACAADMARLPLADNSVDAAVCYASLHHVPDWRTALAEVHRVLRPGGVLVLQEPGKGHSREAESIAQMERHGVLEQDLPPRLLAGACRQAGFSRTLVRPVAELSHGLIRVLPPYGFFREAPRLFVHSLIRRAMATLVESLLNLWVPIHLVVAVKGAACTDSRRPDTMVARFRRVEVPCDLVAGRATDFRVRVQNTGLTRWLADGPEGDCDSLGRVRLGVSRLGPDRRIVDLDFVRVRLPRDVDPGESIELAGLLPPVSESGRAALRFDMVSEGVCWFSEKGSLSHTVDVTVRAEGGGA